MAPNPESEESSVTASDSSDRNAAPHPGPIQANAEAGAKASPAHVELEEDLPSVWHGSGQSPPPRAPAPPQAPEEAPEMARMSFLDHLEELRRRIFSSLIAIVVGFVACWTFADEIYAGFARPLTGLLRELNMEEQLVYTNPVAPFQLYIKLALLAGLFVASPFILWQVWKFISPGLYPHERRYAVPFILLGSLLFLSGGAFAYTIAFPATLRFLLGFAHQFRPMITVNEYFSLAITIILGLALVFELPILVLFLTLLRLMTPGFLLRNFRYAVLVIFVLAAAITPTPDVPTMMLFATPLMVLYFFGVGLSYFVLWLRGRKGD